MGNCGGGSGSPKMSENNTVQLLILGISGCGKTTFQKQMKILHSNGFQEFEIENYRKIICRNISSGLHELLTLLKTSDGKLSDESNETIANFVEENTTFPLTENIQQIKNLWQDKSVQRLWREQYNSMHNAHLEYYIQHIDRITRDDYNPTNEDVIRCRQYTIGASTLTYFYGKLFWKLIDVGGQIPERAKWAAIAEQHKINAVLYFISIDEYDVMSEYEENITKLELSLKVWREVVESGNFIGHCTLLFFNKMDLFENSIKNKKKWKKFKKRFKDYEGEQDYEKASEYIKEKFVDVALEHGISEDELFINFTCAIDSEKMNFAWQAVTDSVLSKRIAIGGF